MFRWNFDLHALFAKSLKEQRSSSSLLKSVNTFCPQTLKFTCCIYMLNIIVNVEMLKMFYLILQVSFVLVEAGDWPNSGYVHVNLDGSAHPLPLTTVYHELHPIQVPPFTFFQVIFGTGYPVCSCSLIPFFVLSSSH